MRLGLNAPGALLFVISLILQVVGTVLRMICYNVAGRVSSASDRLSAGVNRGRVARSVCAWREPERVSCPPRGKPRTRRDSSRKAANGLSEIYTERRYVP